MKSIKIYLFLILWIYQPISYSEEITKDQANIIIQELQAIKKRLSVVEQNLNRLNSKRTLPNKVSLSTANRPMLGNKDAPLTLVEFVDYECAYCRRFILNTLPKLKRHYIDTGKLRIVMRDLPLSFHKHARYAAHAVHCSGEQNKLWEMHDSILIASGKLTQKKISSYANQLKMDLSKYQSCMDSNRYMQQINKDAQDARKLRITGTPSFVLGKTSSDLMTGKRIVGAKPFKAFDAEIKLLLQAQK